MPKAIDRRVIEAAKKAYLNRTPKPGIRKLAREFGLGSTTLFNVSVKERWLDLREAQDKARESGMIEGAKVATRHRPKVSDLDLLNNAIYDVSAEVATIEAKSKEGCASALASLLKAKRDLYPPTADELAGLAVSLNISPTDFIDALKAKWASELQVNP